MRHDDETNTLAPASFKSLATKPTHTGSRHLFGLPSASTELRLFSTPSMSRKTIFAVSTIRSLRRGAFFPFVFVVRIAFAHVVVILRYEFQATWALEIQRGAVAFEAS